MNIMWQALLSLLGTWFGTLNSMGQNNQNRKWLEDMYKKQVEDQRDTMRLQNDFARSNIPYLYSQQTEFEQAMARYNWNHYTSPSAQASAYQKAGLNPALAMQPGSAGVMSSGLQSSHSAQNAQGPSGDAPAGVPQITGQNMFGNMYGSMFQGLASLIKAPAEAKAAEAKAKESESQVVKNEAKDPLSQSLISLNEARSRNFDEATKLIGENIYGQMLQNTLDQQTFDSRRESAMLVPAQIHSQLSLLRKEYEVYEERLKEMRLNNDVNAKYAAKSAQMAILLQATEIELNRALAEYEKEHGAVTHEQIDLVRSEAYNELQRSKIYRFLRTGDIDPRNTVSENSPINIEHQSAAQDLKAKKKAFGWLDYDHLIGGAKTAVSTGLSVLWLTK